MTAKEAKAKADDFHSVENDIVYRKIEKLIEQAVSEGRYKVFVNFSEIELEKIWDSSGFDETEQNLKIVIGTFCGKRFDVEVFRIKKDGIQYEIKIGWSCEHEAGSLKYFRD